MVGATAFGYSPTDTWMPGFEEAWLFLFFPASHQEHQGFTVVFLVLTWCPWRLVGSSFSFASRVRGGSHE
jgi:hypothetical protein